MDFWEGMAFHSWIQVFSRETVQYLVKTELWLPHNPVHPCVDLEIEHV